MKSAGEGVEATDLFTVSVGNGVSEEEEEASLQTFSESFSANANQVADPGVRYSFTKSGLQLVPSLIPAASVPVDSWFTQVSYVGALNPAADNWVKGWTLLDGVQPHHGKTDSFLQ